MRDDETFFHQYTHGARTTRRKVAGVTGRESVQRKQRYYHSGHHEWSGRCDEPLAEAFLRGYFQDDDTRFNVCEQKGEGDC